MMSTICVNRKPHLPHNWHGGSCEGVLELTPENQFVGVIVIGSDGRLLIVHNVKRDQWCIPGGKPEKHEALKAAALRELYEETHLSCLYDDLRFSHEIEHVVAGVKWYGTIFTLRQFYGQPTLKCAEEIDGAMWVTPQRFMALSEYAQGDLGRTFEVRR